MQKCVNYSLMVSLAGVSTRFFKDPELQVLWGKTEKLRPLHWYLNNHLKYDKFKNVDSILSSWAVKDFKK